MTLSRCGYVVAHRRAVGNQQNKMLSGNMTTSKHQQLLPRLAESTAVPDGKKHTFGILALLALITQCYNPRSIAWVSAKMRPTTAPPGPADTRIATARFSQLRQVTVGLPPVTYSPRTGPTLSFGQKTPNPCNALNSKGHPPPRDKRKPRPSGAGYITRQSHAEQNLKKTSAALFILPGAEAAEGALWPGTRFWYKNTVQTTSDKINGISYTQALKDYGDLTKNSVYQFFF